MQNNKYNLVPNEIESKYKGNNLDKLVELAKNGTIIKDENDGTLAGTIGYNAFYNEVRVYCHSDDKNGDSKYECLMTFYNTQEIEVEYSYDSGEIEWKIKTFEAGENKYENECKEKILTVLNYLIDNKLIVSSN